MKDQQMNFSMDAAQLRQSAHNQSAYLEALATRLQAALPSGTVQVTRSFSILSKRRPIKTIVVTIGDNEYLLNFEKSMGIQTAIGNVVRGVVLKTETVPFVEWLQRLTTAIQKYAAVHGETNNLLEEFLVEK